MTFTKILDSDSLKIYSSEISEEWEKSALDERLGKFPSFVRISILKYTNWKDKQLRVLGKELLQRLLADFGESQLADLRTLDYTSNNRPFIKGRIDFNISHSGNKVVCAASAIGKVGLDIEWMAKCNPEDFKEYFNEEDVMHMNADPNPPLLFYRFWTRREALSKAMGSGILFKESISLTDLVNLGKKNYQLTNFDIEGSYIAALALEVII